MTATQSTDIPEVPAARAGRKEWIGLAVLVLPALLISMDMSVLLFGLPFISADLEPSGTQQLWIMDMYGFALAGALITMGAIGDRLGRRRLLMIGAAAFSAASVAAAYSGSAELLIGTRGLLGLAAATLGPSTLGLIRNMFHDEKQRKTAIAVWTGAFIGGVTVGPIVGGLLLDHFWWGSVFLINLPAMALLLILGPALLPEFRAPRAGGFDYLGSILSFAAVLPAIYGIKQIAVDGVSILPLLSVAAGVLLGVAFVVRQRTARNPLIDVTLFRNRKFTVPMTAQIVGAFCLMGISLFNTQLLQSGRGYSPFTAALWSLAAMPIVTVGMTVSGIIAPKVRPAYLIGGGFITSAIGFAILSQVTATNSVFLFLSGAGIGAAGLVAAGAVVTEMVLTAAPADRAGAASALNETGNEFGGALGLALLGSIGAAVYHRDMKDVVVAGVPADAAKSAHETLGGAVAIAKDLPGGAGTALLHTARDAFSSGMHTTTLVGAGLLLATGVATIITLKRVPVPPLTPKEAKAAKAAKAPKAAKGKHGKSSDTAADSEQDTAIAYLNA